MVDITVPNIWNATHEEIVTSTLMGMKNDTVRAQYYGSLPVIGLTVFGKGIWFFDDEEFMKDFVKNLLRPFLQRFFETINKT